MKKLAVLAIIVVGVATTFLLSAVVNSAKVGPLFVQNQPSGWVVSSLPNTEQYQNPSVPLVVIRVVSGVSDPDKDKPSEYLVKEVVVENRSQKEVISVILNWTVVASNNRLTALNRGVLSRHVLKDLNKNLLAGHRQTLKLSHPKLGKMIKDIPNLEGMGKEFIIMIGVSEVTFEDGSTWKEELTEVANKSQQTGHATNPKDFVH
jgi:hypothetical protein